MLHPSTHRASPKGDALPGTYRHHYVRTGLAGLALRRMGLWAPLLHPGRTCPRPLRPRRRRQRLCTPPWSIRSPHPAPALRTPGSAPMAWAEPASRCRAAASTVDGSITCAASISEGEARRVPCREGSRRAEDRRRSTPLLPPPISSGHPKSGSHGDDS